jgi:16S rRNA (guanine966-N2)-methyltransferase
LVSLCGGLPGRSFLDLYAGSGAVGLEAANRGAGPVVLVERDAGAVKVIKSNLAALGVSEVEIAPTAVERFLAGTPRAFDLVFLDAPYADPVAETLTALTAGWLAAQAVICVERATRGPALDWPSGIAALRSRRYGDTTLWYGRAS